MTSVTNSVENLIKSIFQIFGDLLNSVFALFQSILAVFQTILFSLLDLGKSLVNFFLSNIVVLGVLAVGLVVYTAVLQRNGTSTPAGPGLGAKKGRAKA